MADPDSSSPQAAAKLSRLTGSAETLAKSIAAAARARGRRRRDDGWTPVRVRAFLRRLADCGVVEDAARAAGMSRQGAYALRNSAGGRAFALAWDAAQQLARRRLADEAMSRALEGWTERIIRDGKVWGTRNRYDNRLTMRVLERLDRLAAARDEDSLNVRIVAQEFDEFLDIVCAGGSGAETAAFLAPRLADERLDPEPRGRLARPARVLWSHRRWPARISRRCPSGRPQCGRSEEGSAMKNRWTVSALSSSGISIGPRKTLELRRKRVISDRILPSCPTAPAFRMPHCGKSMSLPVAPRARWS